MKPISLLVAELEEAINVKWLQVRRDFPEIPDTEEVKIIFAFGFRLGNIHGRDAVVSQLKEEGALK